MPRQRSLLTVIRDMVQEEVRSAVQSLLGTVSSSKPKAKNGRRRKRRGKWRPGGPGRPPKAVAAKLARKKKAAVKEGGRRRKRRGPGRPPGSKKKAA